MRMARYHTPPVMAPPSTKMRPPTEGGSPEHTHTLLPPCPRSQSRGSPCVDQRDAATKEALHLIAETCLRSPAAVVDSERPHELGKRTTQDQHPALGPHGFSGHTQARIRRGKFPKGSL